MKSGQKLSFMMGCIFLITTFVSTAFADQYPSKPIKLIAPFGAGGSTDSSARIMAKYLEKYLDQKVAVVNVKGAAGTIGTMQAYNSTPDGYTLLWHHLTLITSYHTGVGKFTWDSLTPVCQGVRFYKALTVHADAPWKSLAEFLADAKARPGEIKWGVNLGAGLHFEALGLETATDSKFQFVAGGGDASQVNALLGKHIDVADPSDTVVLQYLETGKLRALATTGEERIQSLPEIPTFIEQGVNFTFYYEPSLFGPPGLPADVIKTLNDAVQKVLKDADAIAEYKKLGMYPAFAEHETFKKNLLTLDADLYKFARKGELIPSRMK